MIRGIPGGSVRAKYLSSPTLLAELLALLPPDRRIGYIHKMNKELAQEQTIGCFEEGNHCWSPRGQNRVWFFDGKNFVRIALSNAWFCLEHGFEDCTSLQVKKPRFFCSITPFCVNPNHAVVK